MTEEFSVCFFNVTEKMELKRKRYNNQAQNNELKKKPEK